MPTDKKSNENNLDKIKKDTASDKAKPRCSICGKYTDKKTSPQCFGHGVAGGDTSDDPAVKSGTGGATSLAMKASKNSDGFKSSEARNSPLNSKKAPLPTPQFKNIKFDPQLISELLSNGLLRIKNDREKGILSIEIKGKQKSLSPELRNNLKKFLESIQNELDNFRSENGISTPCFSQKIKDGDIESLNISFPNPKMYDAFLKRLADKHLLPIQNIEQKNNMNVTYPEGENHFSTARPANKPKPQKDGTVKKEEERSTIRPRSPLDGLKPKNFK